MPDDGTFEEAFAGCRSVRDANALWKTLFAEHVDSIQSWQHAATQVYLSLSEAFRRTLERLSVEQRIERSPTPSDGRVRPRVLRNWCLQRGIPLAKKGRVPMTIENQYREIHGLPLLESKSKTRPSTPPGVDSAAVRTWARTNGIPVGSRGRVHPDLIKQFLEAQ